MRKKTVISALLLDFDGTISPIEVSRERAQLRPLVRSALQKIAKAIPVAVVTTKDMRFIQERVPFAWAWAAIGGIEVKVGDRVLIVPRTVRGSSSFEALLERIETEVREIDVSIHIERKTLSDRRLAAFCVDWRSAKDWDTARRRVDTLLEPFEDKSFTVLRYTSRPYIDVYLEGVDKGQAFITLRRELVNGPIMYLGDSELDNPAFNLAEVSVGILHKETPSMLDCEFFVQFSDVGAFFQELWRNNLTFDSKFRCILRNESREF